MTQISFVPGGGGGHFLWRPYQMLEKKKRGKRVSKSGVGAERADREKGVEIAKNGGGGGAKGIQIAMIRVLGMRSYVEMVGNFKTTCILILTSNQRQKSSELKRQIRAKHKKMLTLNNSLGSRSQN